VKQLDELSWTSECLFGLFSEISSPCNLVFPGSHLLFIAEPEVYIVLHTLIELAGQNLSKETGSITYHHNIEKSISTLVSVMPVHNSSLRGW